MYIIYNAYLDIIMYLCLNFDRSSLYDYVFVYIIIIKS